MPPALPFKRSPTAFFMLVLALAVPLFALGRFAWVIESLKVPVTDLLLGFTPLIAAAILIFRSDKAVGLISFFRHTVDFGGLARTRWLWFALGLAPLIYALATLCLRLLGHSGSPEVNWQQLPLLAIVMFLLAIGEEAGWTGYLLDPLQQRFGALGASLIIAVPWWLGHIPSIIAIGGSALDIAWWLPGAIAMRVLMTWLYNGAGRSVLAVVLFHAMLNLGRLVFYPVIDTHFDPAYQITGYAIASILAAIVVLHWRKTA